MSVYHGLSDSNDDVSDFYEIRRRYIGGSTSGSGGPTFETFKPYWFSSTLPTSQFSHSSSQIILSSFSEEDKILSGNIDETVVVDDTASFCDNDCAHFKKSEFPLAFAFEFYDSRKSIIENRCLTGIGGRSGGNRSAKMTQDVGKERRRRQRREGTVVDGGFGVESSVEIGKVRFEVATIENK